MSAPLDSRVIRIVRWMLAQSEPRSTSDLADDLGLSERVVRYRLGATENYFASHGATLVRQRGTGLSVTGSAEVREAILDDLSARSKEPRVYTPVERERLLLDSLLWMQPHTISLDQLNDDLEVSKTSARRDLRRCEPWLDRMGVPVVRRPGKGVALLGSEQRVRRALVQLFLEAVPGDVLDELLTTDFRDANLIRVRVPAGLRDRFASLPIRECSIALARTPLKNRLARGNSDLIYTLYVAITVARHIQGREIELEPGQYQSLVDHPASELVSGLAHELVVEGLPSLPTHEVAGLTEYLLGFEALTSTIDLPVTDEVESVVGELLAIATDRLHASLADDHELRRSLSLHLTRLAIRLRHGLPVHNPLLAEVTERYADVHAVSVDLAQHLSAHFGATINDDEVGFITMYLSGAMERGHLRPRRRAMVVCPSGMATAWVLVSRLQAEFPELELADVLSASVYEDRDTSEFDLVISTVPLPESGAPVEVVSPLLSSSDVKNLTVRLQGNGY
ncbi:MAG: BglG family transcription antiterminator [Acidimicrobiales bacterium]